MIGIGIATILTTYCNNDDTCGTDDDDAMSTIRTYTIVVWAFIMVGAVVLLGVSCGFLAVNFFPPAKPFLMPLTMLGFYPGPIECGVYIVQAITLIGFNGALLAAVDTGANATTAYSISLGMILLSIYGLYKDTSKS